MDKREPYIALLLLTSVLFFGLGLYVYEYNWWMDIGLGSQWFQERAIKYNLLDTYLFKYQPAYKVFVLLLLAFGMFMMKTKRKLTEDESLKKTYSIVTGVTFTIFILLSFLTELLPSKVFFIVVVSLSLICYLTLGHSFAMLHRLLFSNLLGDRERRDARRFDQFKEKLVNEYSVNIQTADGWINVVNPFRASQVLGTPGSGKTFSFLVEAIIQHIQKGFCMVLYDYKFPDLSELAYNVLKENEQAYEVKPSFKVINFDDLTRSNRCNPLQPDLLLDPTDATQAAQALMLGLYPKWATKQGDFFVESAINYVAACIWALKKINNGKYCTLPHLIQFTGLDYDDMFDILKRLNDNYINNVIAPFLSAHEKKATDQLEGQIATARIALARLTSPTVYYIMAPPEGEGISLQVNDPENPTILCLSNNPDRQKVYSPILSLYNTRIMALINKKNMIKTAMILDELPTLSFPPGTLDNLIATARSNKIAVWLGYQDFAQLVRDLGKEIADAIINTVGNTFTGMVNFETAKKLSEKFGKIKVKKESVTINDNSSSVQHSVEMAEIVPASEISSLKQGTFVGNVTDDYGYEMDQKVFYSPVLIDLEYRKTLKSEIPPFVDLKKKLKLEEGYSLQDALDVNFLRIVEEIDYLNDDMQNGFPEERPQKTNEETNVNTEEKTPEEEKDEAETMASLNQVPFYSKEDEEDEETDHWEQSEQNEEDQQDSDKTIKPEETKQEPDQEDSEKSDTSETEELDQEENDPEIEDNPQNEEPDHEFESYF